MAACSLYLRPDAAREEEFDDGETPVKLRACEAETGEARGEAIFFAIGLRMDRENAG